MSNLSAVVASLTEDMQKKHTVIRLRDNNITNKVAFDYA